MIVDIINAIKDTWWENPKILNVFQTFCGVSVTQHHDSSQAYLTIKNLQEILAPIVTKLGYESNKGESDEVRDLRACVIKVAVDVDEKRYR